MEVGAPINPDEVLSSQTVGASAFVIFPLHHKTQRMACKNMFVGNHPWAPPHAYTNRRWGNPARMQHNFVLRQRVVFMRT